MTHKKISFNDVKIGELYQLQQVKLLKIPKHKAF